MSVLLDTGSTLSYVDPQMVDIIAQPLLATIDPAGNYVVNCAWHNAPGTIDITFNDRMTIRVPFKDFIWQTDQKGYCLLGVQPAEPEAVDYVFGNSILRGAYCELAFASFYLRMVLWGSQR